MLVRGPRWGCYSSPCTLTIRQIPARGFFVGSGSPLGMLFEPLHAHNQTDPREGILLVQGPCWGMLFKPMQAHRQTNPREGILLVRGPRWGDAIQARARHKQTDLREGILLVRGPCWGMLFKPMQAHRQTNPREGIFCWFRVPTGGCYSSLCTLTDRQILAKGFFVGSGSPLGDAIQARARSQTDKSSRGDLSDAGFYKKNSQSPDGR